MPRGRIDTARRLAPQLAVLAAAAAWPFLYRPSWHWYLVAGALYLAASGIVLSAFLRGARGGTAHR